MHMISFENDLLKPWSGGGGGPRPRSPSSVTFFVFNSTNSIISFILMEITNIIGQRRDLPDLVIQAGRTTLPCELPRHKRQDKITRGRLSLYLVNLSDCPTEQRSRSGARQEGKPLIFNSMMSLHKFGKKTTILPDYAVQAGRPGHGLLDHIKQRR